MYGFFFAYCIPNINKLQKQLIIAGSRIFNENTTAHRQIELYYSEYFTRIVDETNVSLLTISEHSNMSIIDLTYNMTTLELFSLWNSVIHKVEIQQIQAEKQNNT